MTIILALGNSDQFIQLSDRRLSSNGRSVDEESNKAGSIICADARFIFGFSGLATIGTFKTRQWILETLYQSGPPDYTAYETLKRFTDRASVDFRTLPWLKDLSPSEKRLSIIFSGYLDSHRPPLGAGALISNYQDWAANVCYPEAQDNFLFAKTNERRPSDEPMFFMQRIGNWPAMYKPDELSLRALLKDKKPKHAIISKCVELIRTMADRPEAHGTIGKQITSICIFRDPRNATEVGYHSNVTTYDNYLPSQVVSVSDNEHIMMMDPRLQAQESNGTPVLFIPKVARKAPCPCKSGKRYKHCHGKKRG